MDTLARAKKLEALGFDRPRAEGLVQMVKESIHEEVAKKADLLELRAEIKLDMAIMKNDIAEMKVQIGGIKSEIGGMKDEIVGIKSEIAGMKGEIAGMKGEIRGMKDEIVGIKSEIAGIKVEIAGIKGEIKHSRLKTIVWLGSIMFSLMSLMFAGLVYLEPIRKMLITP